MYNEIGKIVGDLILQCDLNEETISSFMDLIKVLNPMNFKRTNNLINGACAALQKFSSSEGLCSKCIKEVFTRFFNEEESKWLVNCCFYPT